VVKKENRFVKPMPAEEAAMRMEVVDNGLLVSSIFQRAG
jgi:hypothetical protein